MGQYWGNYITCVFWWSFIHILDRSHAGQTQEVRFLKKPNVFGGNLWNIIQLSDIWVNGDTREACEAMTYPGSCLAYGRPREFLTLSNLLRSGPGGFDTPGTDIRFPGYGIFRAVLKICIILQRYGHKNWVIEFFEFGRILKLPQIRTALRFIGFETISPLYCLSVVSEVAPYQDIKRYF